jgi:hypothetical protein
MPLEIAPATVIFGEMNRLAGFVLIGGFLASGAGASAAGANHVTSERNTYLAAPPVQQSVASAVEALPAPLATLAPATVTRIIPSSQAAPRAALPPVAAEVAPAAQASTNPCPAGHTDIACRKP